nr:DUF2382 domain-containing protein [uncultured Lichenicoccus sp.]
MPSAPSDGPCDSLLLHEEAIVVTRRRVVGDTVRIETVTREHQQQIETSLVQERVEIEHVPVGRMIERAPEIRTEGDVTIIPVVEEVLVVERRLVLKEEIHMRRVRVSEPHQQMVTLRRQEAVVTRFHPDPDQGGCEASLLSQIVEEKAHD